MCNCDPRGGFTVSGIHLGLGAGGFADEDGDVGVVALHGGIRPGQEGPVIQRKHDQLLPRKVSFPIGLCYPSNSLISLASFIPGHPPSAGSAEHLHIPHGGALLRSLAEQEAHLLEALGESVSAGHGGRWCLEPGRGSRVSSIGAAVRNGRSSLLTNWELLVGKLSREALPSRVGITCEDWLHKCDAQNSRERCIIS